MVCLFTQFADFFLFLKYTCIITFTNFVTTVKLMYSMTLSSFHPLAIRGQGFWHRKWRSTGSGQRWRSAVHRVESLRHAGDQPTAPARPQAAARGTSQKVPTVRRTLTCSGRSSGVTLDSCPGPWLIVYVYIVWTTFQNVLVYVRRVAEYIPPRPMFPKRTDGAQRVSLFDFSAATLLNSRVTV